MLIDKLRSRGLAVGFTFGQEHVSVLTAHVTCSTDSTVTVQKTYAFASMLH